MAAPTLVNRPVLQPSVVQHAKSVRFGADTTPTAPSKPQTPPTSPSKGIRQYVEQAIDFFRKCLGFVDGIAEGFGVIKNAKAWNKALETADPQANYYDRTMAILDITYAAFRESVQKTLKQKTDDANENVPPSNFKPNAGNFSLYASILESYPALLKVNKSLPGGFNLVKRALENQPDWSDEVRNAKLKSLQDTDFSSYSTAECLTQLDNLFAG